MSVTIGGNSHLPTMNGGESAEVYSAALAKNQQKAEGRAALALIQSAVQTAPPPPSPNPAVGNNINIKV